MKSEIKPRLPLIFRRRQSLTYILGCRCDDGIVIVSDRRIWADIEYTSGDKIFKPIENVVIGCSGFRGIIGDLKDETERRLEGSQTTLEKIRTIETIIRELNELYKPRLLDIYPRNVQPEEINLLECLVAIKEESKTRLFKIFSIGYHEEIYENNYGATGSGEPYGKVFVKKLLEEYFKANQKANKLTNPRRNLLALA